MSALVKIVSRRALRAVEEARTRGGMRVGIPLASLDAGDLEILAKWAETSVPAPPEGAPTWDEIRSALLDGMASLGRAGETWQRMNDVLSRLPKEEP